MKYCILLDAVENAAKIVPVKKGTKLLQMAYGLMNCDAVQLVPLYPDRLPKGFEAICDEDTFGKMKIFNPLASWLYGCDDHGATISNNVVIFKLNKRGDDFCLMEEDEAHQIADDLNARANEIYDLTMFKAMTARS